MEPPACGRRCSRRCRAPKPKDADTGTPATIEVYSGLYVNEATDISKMDSFDDVSREKQEEDPNSIYISQKHFAIGIAVAGLILMLGILLQILIITFDIAAATNIKYVLNAYGCHCF